MAFVDKFALVEWMRVRVLEIEHEKVNEAFDTFCENENLRDYLAGVADVCCAMLAALEVEDV